MNGSTVWRVPQASALCAPFVASASGGCGHKRCSAWRRVAQSTCRVCKRRIGWDVAIRVDPRPELGQVEERPIHRDCEERERLSRRIPDAPSWAEKQRVARCLVVDLKAGGRQARDFNASLPPIRDDNDDPHSAA